MSYLGSIIKATAVVGTVVVGRRKLRGEQLAAPREAGIAIGLTGLAIGTVNYLRRRTA